jgi:uncharacterized protein (DUF1919 family)
MNQTLVFSNKREEWRLSKFAAKLAQKKQDATDYLLGWYLRRQLNSKDFSVICNTCLAGTGVYHKFQLRYTSPTVGTFIFTDDYIRFLENFYFYIKQPLKFISKSKYEYANKRLEANYYPVGVLGGDVEIHFVHYKSESEANEKWLRRSQRINFDKLFFVFAELLIEEPFNEKWLDHYAKLPFEHKIFISTKPRDYEDFVIFVKEQNGKTPVHNFIVGRPYEKYFDLVAWLNGERNFKK